MIFFKFSDTSLQQNNGTDVGKKKEKKGNILQKGEETLVEEFPSPRVYKGNLCAIRLFRYHSCKQQYAKSVQCGFFYAISSCIVQCSDACENILLK